MSKYTLGEVPISSTSKRLSDAKRHIPRYGQGYSPIAAYIYTSNARDIQDLFCTNIG